MSGGRLDLDDEEPATSALRRAYAAPIGVAYWQELESRIMARIAEVDLAWWTELDRWRRPAMVAAAALLFAAGMAMYRARQAEAARVYEELVTPADADAQPNDAVTPSSPRAAMLRSLLVARN
jgi:hypothetical protein